MVLLDLMRRASVLSFADLISVCIVSSRSSRQICMSAWPRQWRVSDQEDRTERSCVTPAKGLVSDRTKGMQRGAE